MAIDKPLDLTKIKDASVDATLKTLRDQRDTKQEQRVSGLYVLNPQVFNKGAHFVSNAIYFNQPFQTTPAITFGQTAQRAVENITKDTQSNSISSYVPLIIHSYVYGFEQDSKGVKAFYLGLYAMTSVPESAARYVISWHAHGRAMSYPQQRIDESWHSAYNPNEADHLVNDTDEVDSQ